MLTAEVRAEIPNDLNAFWLPFTPNRSFKKRPRLLSRAKDMHYYTPEGRAILDTTAALWCCNAGHNRAPIVAAIQRQAAELDFAPNFQFAHPLAFQLASRIAQLAPADLDHVFFCNSGSEACDSALNSWADHSERGQGPSGKAIRSGEINYVQDFSTDPQVAPWHASALKHGYLSSIALPFKDENGRKLLEFSRFIPVKRMLLPGMK